MPILSTWACISFDGKVNVTLTDFTKTSGVKSTCGRNSVGRQPYALVTPACAKIACTSHILKKMKEINTKHKTCMEILINSLKANPRQT